MPSEIRIALDAMGGDKAPDAIVRGAVHAVRYQSKIRVILVGQKEVLKRSLSEAKKEAAALKDRGRQQPLPGWEDRLSIQPASEVIGTAEHPVEAIMRKRDSSMVVALNMVKRGEAEAAVSAGNSGALMVGGQGIVGRIRGVQRPPFGTLIPTRRGALLLVDSGANVDARPQFLTQWAKMGTIYMQNSLGIKEPRVGILNIGAEEEKGNSLVKETFPLLKQMDAEGQIHFAGSCEARDVPEGPVDVLVCDGFAGNVLLKMYEGTAKVLLGVVKESLLATYRSKVGALLIKSSLKKSLKKFDSSQYGGAPILGLRGLVVKMHGSAGEKEVENSMVQCLQFYQQKIADRIEDYARMEKARADQARRDLAEKNQL